jgi:hypothetical protein
MCPKEEKIVLWHSTSLSNKDSILKNGIFCFPLTKNQAKQKIKEFQDIVSEKLGVKFRTKHYTLERMLEASEKGNVVYLSDEKDYSMQNALASQEWKSDLIRDALKKKFPKEYRKLENLRAYSCKASRKWKKHEQEKMGNLPDYAVERRKIICENLRLYDLRNNARTRHSNYARIMRAKEQKYSDLFFSTECVVFKIELPRSVFLSLHKDGPMKLERKDFHEVYLTNVPLKYIVSDEEFNIEKWERARRSASDD